IESGTATTEGEIGELVLAIEGQSQETVDADATGNSENVAIWKSTSDRRGRLVSQGHVNCNVGLCAGPFS
ncbi:hypothetical protein Tco_1148102, partial [Tanacetum coccineum]